MTPAGVTTVLMALGMTWEEADNSLGAYCNWHGRLPLKKCHLRFIWKIYKGRY